MARISGLKLASGIRFDPRRLPGRTLALAAAEGARRQAAHEWFGTPPHLWLLARPPAEDFAAFPRDLRPARAEVGRALLAGRFDFGGEVLAVGKDGDPFDRPAPSRRFAVELHQFAWLRDLLAAGPAGAKEAWRLIGLWDRVFGRWNAFAWSGEVLDRRAFNLACAVEALVLDADDLQRRLLAELIARQGRQLLMILDPSTRRAERAVAACLAGAMLGGRPGEKILEAAFRKLTPALESAVLPDGGHASRAPEAGLELLLDLLSLDSLLVLRGLETPEAASRAIDRLTGALRFFCLADGRIACFQGGEEGDVRTLAAARAHDDDEAAPPPAVLPHSRYERMTGRAIQVMVDTGPPAGGAWSATACAQPLALEILCGRDRLITNSGWSPRAPAAQAFRLTDAGSTVSLGLHSAGEPHRGFRARWMGPRLKGAAETVEARRTRADTGLWLEASHDGWVRTLGLRHERRLYLDLLTDQLRGEDRFTQVLEKPTQRVIPYAVRFHLHPEAKAFLARDNHSVLLTGPSGVGWWLRNDAHEVRLEPAIHFRDGRQQHTQVVVLAGHLRADKGWRIRWKLAKAEA